MNTAAFASSAFNSVDYFVFTIFGLSVLMGYMRGFLVEVISLGTLIAATFISSMFSSKLAETFSGTGSKTAQSFLSAAGTSANVDQPISMLAVAGSFVALFLVTMIGGFIVKTIIVGVTQGPFMSLTNRFLGAAFGIVRGFLITIVTMFILELTPVGAQPAWAQSRFVQSFSPIVKTLDKIVAPGLERVKAQTQSVIDNAGGQMDNMKSMFDSNAQNFNSLGN